MENLGDTGKEISSLECKGLHDGHVDRMSGGAGIAPASPGDFSGDDHGPYHALSMVVGEWNTIIQKSGDEVRALVGDARLNDFGIIVLVAVHDDIVNLLTL